MSGVQHSDHVIRGVRVRVREGGTGIPLLLIHGLGGSQMWQKVLEPLSSHYHLIVPDLPGFGESECPARPWTTTDYVDFLGDLTDQLSVNVCNLAGISYGGEISSLFCSRFPGRVERLVLIASTGFNAPRWIAVNEAGWIAASLLLNYTFLRSRMFLAVNGAKSFYDRSNRPEDFVEHFYRQLSQKGKREAFLQCVRNISKRRTDFFEELKHITAPTLILWGENDRIIPVRHALNFEHCIPNATMKTFHQCGHSVPLEKPQEVSREVFRFLSKGGDRETGTG